MNGWTDAVRSLALVTLLLAGCAPEPPAVEQFGAMREVMREGHTGPRIRLADAVAQPHAIGVGALEGLGGEVTIVGGDVWVARNDDGELRVTGPEPVEGDQATLLTLAHVATWQSVPIDIVADGRALEALLEEAARAHGLDATRPFPFVIEGAVAGLDLHVINGYCPVATDPAAIGAEPWRWSSPPSTDALIVGFFAPGAAGVLTHHGTSMHAHAILWTDGVMVTGHADRIAVAPGMTLRLPASD